MNKNLIRLSHPTRKINGTITLNGSKSISNRVLIIQALCGKPFQIKNLSDSDDTQTLQRLLQQEKTTYDAHHAGTTFRFLTAYLSRTDREVILTGSDRMKERPIGPLVAALNSIGASITYQEKEEFPPLRIAPPNGEFKNEVTISSSISSQYISALLLIAPTLKNGLKLTLDGALVSRPYLMMTLNIMQYFGVFHTWQDQTINIPPQVYKAKDFHVEADWSAASYYYITAALSKEADIILKGLSSDSLQGDHAIVEIGKSFGVKTTFEENGIRITKDGKKTDFFEYDFLNCPDIAQSVSTMAAGSAVSTLFSGLQTLRIKETDRIAALQSELAKVHVYLSKLPERFSKKKNKTYFMQEGSVNTDDRTPRFATYKDHRMAMAFAPLALLFPIEIEKPMVVTKSYPDFWKDLQKIGFDISE